MPGLNTEEQSLDQLTEVTRLAFKNGKVLHIIIREMRLRLMGGSTAGISAVSNTRRLRSGSSELPRGIKNMARKFPGTYSDYRLSERGTAPHFFLTKAWRDVDIRLTVKQS